MAKVQVSPLLSNIAGKTGVCIFSRSQAGTIVWSYYHKRPKPPLTLTPAQIHLRYLSQLWSLSSMGGFRFGWGVLAASITKPDRFGTIRHPTPKNLFLAANINLWILGLPDMLAAPATFTAGSPIAVTLTRDAGPPVRMLVTPTANPAAREIPVLYGLHRHAAGVTRLPNQWKFLTSFPPGTAGPYDVYSHMVSDVGYVYAGSPLAAKLKYTNADTGAAGPAFTDTIIWS